MKKINLTKREKILLIICGIIAIVCLVVVVVFFASMSLSEVKGRIAELEKEYLELERKVAVNAYYKDSISELGEFVNQNKGKFYPKTTDSFEFGQEILSALKRFGFDVLTYRSVDSRGGISYTEFSVEGGISSFVSLMSFFSNSPKMIDVPFINYRMLEGNRCKVVFRAGFKAID
ncbi:MAG: hypothetical protein JXR63_05840 [Spirochaetales bacterium]|nr:hypothetical protein [Spirochaetales bacterium]